MATQSVIYIVRDINDGYRRDPVGAFTDKELLTRWLKLTDPYGFTITTVRDGNLYASAKNYQGEEFPDTITAEEFLAKG